MKIGKPKRKKTTRKAANTAPRAKEKATGGDTVRLNVNVPREIYRQLRIKAAEKETSVSVAVIGLIENYIARG